jgi:cell division protein ZapA (FtsZ GTPase activity inhibitor)
VGIYQYSLEKDALIIRTGHGQFKYKIEDAELLKMADKIASEVISELKSIDNEKGSIKDDLSDYAKLMLATLNICEKHITLKNKYEQLNQTVKSMKEVLSQLDPANASVTAKRPGHSSKIGYTPVQTSNRPATQTAGKDSPREAIANNAIHQPKPGSTGQAAHNTATATKPGAASAAVTITEDIKPAIPASASSSVNLPPAKTSVSPAPNDATDKKNVPSPEKAADIGASLSNDKQSSLGKNTTREPFQSINPSAHYQSGSSANRILQSGTTALSTHLAPDVPLSS